MFGFKKRKAGAPPPVVTAADEGTDLRYFAALLTIVHSRWPDIEEAKTLAAQIALLASVELEVVAPEFKNTHTPVQRAIAAALYVTISKSGVRNLGKESLIRIFEGTRDFARHSGEMPFYNTTGKAFRIF
jgi:hypothetical protein